MGAPGANSSMGRDCALPPYENRVITSTHAPVPANDFLAMAWGLLASSLAPGKWKGTEGLDPYVRGTEGGHHPLGGKESTCGWIPLLQPPGRQQPPDSRTAASYQPERIPCREARGRHILGSWALESPSEFKLDYLGD